MAVIWWRLTTIEDGIPRLSEETAEVAFRWIVSFTKVVPQSLVLMVRLRLTAHVEESHIGAGDAARAMLGI